MTVRIKYWAENQYRVRDFNYLRKASSGIYLNAESEAIMRGRRTHTSRTWVSSSVLSYIQIIMAALWNRGPLYFCPVVTIFLSKYLSIFFFLAKSQRPEIGCLPYFDTWCGPSANLECMSEMCGTRLAENSGRKKSRQKSPSGHHRTAFN